MKIGRRRSEWWEFFLKKMITQKMFVSVLLSVSSSDWFAFAALARVPTHPGMVSVHEELRLGAGGAGRHAGRHERVEHRLFASSSAVVQLVAAARLGEHPDALRRRRAFAEHRVAPRVRSACEHSPTKRELRREHEAPYRLARKRSKAGRPRRSRGFSAARTSTVTWFSVRSYRERA